MAKTKEEIFGSDLSPIEMVWECVKDRQDLGRGTYGIVTDPSSGLYARVDYCTRCCVVGAVLDGMPSTGDYQQDFARLIDMPVDWVLGLVVGFDGDENDIQEQSYGFAAGQEIRRRLAERGVRL